jgi:hypothetical protein
MRLCLSKALNRMKVLKMDVTRAYAHAEADAKSDADKKTLKLLQDYLSAYKTNDGTVTGDNYVKACHNSLSKVFDENVAPETAAEECNKALSAKVEEIIKEVNKKDEDNKSPNAQKKQPYKRAYAGLRPLFFLPSHARCGRWDSGRSRFSTRSYV